MNRVMQWLLAPLAALLGVLLSTKVARARSATSQSESPMSNDPDYPPSVWEPIVRTLLSTAPYSRLDFRAVMAWGDMESGWNACAIGEPGDTYQGQPREIGLGQLYNPDDFNRIKLVTPAKLRAYCIPGTQRRSRKLTADEMIEQVRYTILDPMTWGVAKANEAVHAYGLSAWSVPDFYKLVKAPHALPGIIGSGLPAVVKKLGRAPQSWNEFRQTLGMDDPEARRKATSGLRAQMTDAEKTHWRWMRALDACEKLGNSVTPSIA